MNPRLLLPFVLLFFGFLLAAPGQEAHAPVSDLFLTGDQPTKDEFDLELPPGPAVAPGDNKAPADFRGYHEWPERDGTKTKFSYQGFRWSRRQNAEGVFWGVNVVLNIRSVVSELPAESLGLTPAAGEQLRHFLWRDYDSQRDNSRRNQALRQEAAQWEARILTWSKNPLSPRPLTEKNLPGRNDFDELPDVAKPFKATVFGTDGGKQGMVALVNWGMRPGRKPSLIPVRIRWEDGSEEETTTTSLRVMGRPGDKKSTHSIQLMLMHDYYRQRISGGPMLHADAKLAALKQMLADWWAATELERGNARQSQSAALSSWNTVFFREGSNLPFGLVAPDGYLPIDLGWDRSQLRALPEEHKAYAPNGMVAMGVAPFLLWWHQSQAAVLTPPGKSTALDRMAMWLAESLTRSQRQRQGDAPSWRNLPGALSEFAKRQWNDQFVIRSVHDWTFSPATLVKYATGSNGCLILLDLKEGEKNKGVIAVSVFHADAGGHASIGLANMLLTGKWKEWPLPPGKSGAPAGKPPLPVLEFEIANQNTLPADSPFRKFRLYAHRGERLGVFAFNIYRQDPAAGPVPRNGR